jgi:hypothetical protein
VISVAEQVVAQTDSGTSPDYASAPGERWIAPGLLLALLALLCVHAWSLMRYPLPYVDEAWLLSRAWSWRHTGIPLGQLDVGVLDLVANGWRAHGLSGTILQSLSLSVGNPVDLRDARVESLVFGVALLLVMFAIGRALADARLGLLCAVLTACGRLFFKCAHLARPEIYVAVLTYGGLALLLLNPRRGLALAALAGALFGLAADIHPNATLLLLSAGSLFLFGRGKHALRDADFWCFACVAGLSIALPLAARIAPDPQGYARIMALLFGFDHAPPVLSGDLRVLADSALEMLWLIHGTHPGGAPVLVGSMVMLAFRNDALSRRVAVIAGGVLLSFVLLIGAKKEFYALAFSPALALMVAAAVYQLPWRRRSQPLLQIGLLLLALGLIGRMLVLGLPRIERDGFAEYRVAQQRINALIRPSDSVMGRQQYWLGLQDQVFHSWEALPFYRHAHPRVDLATAFAVYRPDILIIDQGLRQFITDGPAPDDVIEYLRLPEAQMTAFLKQRATLLGRFASVYGPTMVFRLRWD